MIVAQALEKMQGLPQLQQQEVLDFVEFLNTKYVRPATNRQKQMTTAAQTLLADYETDAELTAFTSLIEVMP